MNNLTFDLRDSPAWRQRSEQGLEGKMRSYEDLAGAQGRRMFYRARRYRPEELFSELMPAAELDGDRGALKDLSMTGLAVQSAKMDHWDNRVGTQVPVRLCVGENPLYQGTGIIRRVEPNGIRATVAVELITGFINVGNIVTEHDGLLLNRALSDRSFGESEGILPEYKELCAEIIYLFRSYQQLLEKFESRLTVTGRERERMLIEALTRCEERMVPQWKELWYRGNDIVTPIMSDPVQVAAHKRYTERVLTPDFMPGRVMRRCYEKPLGYPGDYQIMNYVYRWERIGDTPYEKLLHRIGIETGACVATRMRMMRGRIADRVKKHVGERPVNITNLGCGSAQEMLEYLSADHLPHPVNITLIDQDHDALSFAYEQAHPHVVRHGGRVKIQCLQASFAQLAKAGSLFKALPPQDLIYTLGLFDYFPSRRARSLAHDLFAQLAPEGQLVIANVKIGRETCMWPLEFITDWSLIYRTEAEMRDMVEGLPNTGTTVEVDPTQCVYLLAVDKPAETGRVN